MNTIIIACGFAFLLMIYGLLLAILIMSGRHREAYEDDEQMAALMEHRLALGLERDLFQDAAE
jgi:predicted histidine transporter YuiF (NhaC family)